jgi:ferredoxin
MHEEEVVTVKDLLTKPFRPRRATKAFLEEARRMPGFSRFDALHGYVYARWPYLYIGIATGEHPLTRVIKPLVLFLSRLFPFERNDKGNQATVAVGYHGKVVTTKAAKQLVMVKEPIRLPDLEQVIPYDRARDIILQNPDHIVVLECPCRSSRPDPCMPLDVCLVVGEPFAGLVVEHHPRRSRWITQEEAVDILEKEHSRGHVHHAFFKDAMLGRFYAICNCCSCCCGAMQAMRNGSPMLISSGYVSQIDDDLCTGCGDCVEVCPFDALEVSSLVAEVDPEACMGCGVCVSNCEHGALSLVRDPSKGEPLEIQELLAHASIVGQVPD